jgi:5'-deoxynucleotidase YfbR-like HD superfamily hydrolase
VSELDLNNIKFFMQASKEQLREWYEQASDADLIYAAGLLDQYASYIQFEAREQRINAAIDRMPVMLEAQAVIAAFRA